MALIKCYECNDDISDKAKACPHCGAPKIRTIMAHVQMQHLRFLKIINYVHAAILFALGLLLAIGTIFSVGLGLWMAFSAVATASPEVKQTMLAAGISTAMHPAAYTIIPTLFLFVVALLMYLAGNKIGQGRGRSLQTVVALLAVFTGCIGILYAGYALWVCWLNKETVTVFSRVPSETGS